MLTPIGLVVTAITAFSAVVIALRENIKRLNSVEKTHKSVLEDVAKLRNQAALATRAEAAAIKDKTLLLLQEGMAEAERERAFVQQQLRARETSVRTLTSMGSATAPALALGLEEDRAEAEKNLEIIDKGLRALGVVFKEVEQAGTGAFEEIAKTTEKAATAVSTVVDELQELRERLDPTIAATRAYDEGVKLLNAGLESGAIPTTKEYQRLLGLLGEEYLSTTGSAFNFAEVLETIKNEKFPGLLAATANAVASTEDLETAFSQFGFVSASAFEDAIINGEKFSDVLGGLEDDILRIITRLQILDPLARGIASGLGVLTGGANPSSGAGGIEGLVASGLGLALSFLGPGAPAGVTATNNPSVALATSTTSFRQGGVVGRAGSKVLRSPSVFAGAPSMQTGGVAGLRFNEVPTILHRGERVIPVGMDSGGPSEVTVNFHGVTDFESFRKNEAQMRGLLLDVQGVAQRRDR